MSIRTFRTSALVLNAAGVLEGELSDEAIAPTKAAPFVQATRCQHGTDFVVIGSVDRQSGESAGFIACVTCAEALALEILRVVETVHRRRRADRQAASAAGAPVH